MKLTLNQAAREAKKSKATLLESIKSGKLTAPKNENGAYEIEPAELFRVFPVPVTEHSEKPKPTPLENHENDQKTSVLQAKIDAAHEQLELLEKHHARERETMRGEIDDLRQRLDSEGEERRKITAMLTDQRQNKGFFARLFGR